MKKYNSRIIIACDFKDIKELYEFLSHFGNEKLFLKLGMRIIYKEGFSIIDKLRDLGHNIFIDLKVFDIPTTTQYAVRSLLSYKPDFLTLHLSGGLEMTRLCQEEVKNTNTKLLGVTVLTSMNQNDFKEFNMTKKVNDHIKDLMLVAQQANIYAVVCSGHDAHIANKLGLVTVVPGIRINDMHNDQKRITTPSFAINNKADFLVIGRSITKNKNPYSVYKQILKEIS